MKVGGKTDNAQIPADLVAHLYDIVDQTKLKETFGPTTAVIYGEGYGAGIQKVGTLYSKTKKFIAFDVFVDNKWWVNWENTVDITKKLNLDVVPYIGDMTLEEAVEIVRKGFPSKLNPELQAEGLVGRTVETLFDKKGNRLIIKLKTKDF